MAVLVVTLPGPLVSLDEAKAHLRVTSDDENDSIEGYIAAACAWIDGPWGWLGRCIGKHVLEVRSNVFGGFSRLPLGPVQAIVSVQYVAADGVERTLDPAEYVLDDDAMDRAPGFAWPLLRGDPNGVRVRYEAGFVEVPKPVKQAVLLLVGQWFSVREAVNVGNIVTEPPFAVRALLGPYRIIRV
ncbi:head-tail connector protein [Brevundimonas pondensis]|uniref:Phage gp6-like head-tail connector protein n=1 Tax=Brevundimonas pondensis TaxID=2774189 RepID=A0ABX7SL32_9CAUL|nr:head-tail connector protein [Brevundimonas pondensis]QTC88183.1 phage gp6-like head-tail connector protein [Brevundimonas pondensis]